MVISEHLIVVLRSVSCSPVFKYTYPSYCWFSNKSYVITYIKQKKLCCCHRSTYLHFQSKVSFSLSWLEETYWSLSCRVSCHCRRKGRVSCLNFGGRAMFCNPMWSRTLTYISRREKFVFFSKNLLSVSLEIC